MYIKICYAYLLSAEFTTVVRNEVLHTKTLITNKCTKSFVVTCNTLLHVSTLLGHLQGELFYYPCTKVALYS
jgi:hypothetical protein